MGEIDSFLRFRPGRVGEMKKAGEGVFFEGDSCLIGEMKKSGEVDFFGGDSSLIGAHTRNDGRLPIKGTDPELDVVIASDVGVARSSLIGADICSLDGDLMSTTGANDFFI